MVANARHAFQLALGDRHRSVTRFLVAIVVIACVLGVMSIGQKEDPDFTFRDMIVQVMWPGASLTDMQDQVVNKIERKLQETPHLDFLRSFTRAGSAIITVQIKGDTFGSDVTDAFNRCAEGRRHRQDLPTGIYGPYFNDEFGDTFITSTPSRRRLFLPWGSPSRRRAACCCASRRREGRGPRRRRRNHRRLPPSLPSGISVLDIQNALSARKPSRRPARRNRSGFVRINVGGDIGRRTRRPPPQARRAGRPLGDIAITSGLEDPFARKFH
jgi:hypothetical protein